MSFKPLTRSAWAGFEPKPSTPYLAIEPEELLTKIKRRDWSVILNDLIAEGVSLSEVGRRTGKSTVAVTGWRDDVDPKDTDARKVLALHRKHCPHRYKSNVAA